VILKEFSPKDLRGRHAMAAGSTMDPAEWLSKQLEQTNPT
jgi:hypothetical protein